MKEKLFKPNMISAAFFYIGVMFIGSSLLGFLFAFIASNMTNVSYIDIIAAITNEPVGEDAVKIGLVVSAWVSAATYALLAIFIPFYTRDTLIEDYRAIKKDPLKMISIIVISAIVFNGITFLLDWLLEKYSTVGVSQNQMGIEQMIEAGYGLIIFIPIVILAPIVEELIYRKTIFKIFDRNKIIAFLFSVVAFVLPHMISTSGTPVEWIIMCLPYLISAIMLASIYLISKGNVYVVIVAHMINNLIAFIQIL